MSYRINLTRKTAAMVAVAVVLVACGEASTFPTGSRSLVANSDLGTGESRLQVGIVGPEGERLGSPDDTVSLKVAPNDGGSEPAVYPAEWMWLIPNVVGLYRADIELPDPGVWSVAVIPEEGSPLPPSPFQVRQETLAPSVGDPAPVAPMDTLATKSIDELTTDTQPDPDFYQMTLEEAFSSGRRTVVVFSTPAFCQTATCGPTLDMVKQSKQRYPDVNFIHVEVYTDLNAPGFTPTPEFLHPAIGAEYWNLPTEPWVFVVDEDGTVTARFEGALTSDDMINALG